LKRSSARLTYAKCRGTSAGMIALR